ncbi:MAG: M20 family metallopeptidase [Deltaproteobacteria bacterium]|nr:M20 family metallopeptidase [Deltaproteobacteria bacterium]
MNDLLATIKTRAQEMTGELVALRRDFHQHPELSHQEERTARVVADYLRELGLKVRTGVAGHGVVADLAGARPGRCVAYRADMDALPLQEKVQVPWRSKTEGVMHACGHDFHLSIALAAAKLLSGLRDRLAGHFRFILQPAEERPAPDGLSGARAMVELGVLEQDPPVKAILALHVAPNLEAGRIRSGSEVVMAGADRVTLTIAGKPAHGATPHRGVDPILVSALALNHIQAFLAQRIDPRAAKVLTFGRINGGNRFNILADEVTLVGSLRYLQDATRTELLHGLRKVLEGLSQATGARIEFSAGAAYPILKNDPHLSRQAVAVLENLLSPQLLKPLRPAMGSEDFAFFASKVPGFYFFLGVRPPGGHLGQALHSPDFNPDEAALPYGLTAAAGLLAAFAEPEK